MEWVFFISCVFWGPYLVYAVVRRLTRPQGSPGGAGALRRSRA